MFRLLYYTTFLIFLFSAIIFWVYADEFFNWLFGFTSYDLSQAVNVNRDAFERAVSGKETFIYGVVFVSVVCLVFSIFAISTKMKGRVLAYISLLMSAITIMMFIISFFGHGVLPTHGII